MGRPSKFTEAAADEICARLAGGDSLRKICDSNGMPPLRTVMAWLAARPDFQQQYTRARELWADAEFDAMMHIADTPVVGVKTKTDADGNVETTEGDMIEHRRLQVDTRKWALARMSPRKYGDKLGLHGVEDQPGIKMEVLSKLAEGRARVAKLRGKPVA